MSTIILNQVSDPRPENFVARFETKGGVEVSMVIHTRESGIAEAIKAKVTEQMGWDEKSPQSEPKLWEVPFYAAAITFVLGLACAVGTLMLYAAGWLPHLHQVTEYGIHDLDSTSTVMLMFKYIVRGSLVAWPVLTVLGLFAVLVTRGVRS